jgi:hypothetical protein
MNSRLKPGSSFIFPKPAPGFSLVEITVTPGQTAGFSRLFIENPAKPLNIPS